jgi:FKBP-type peptidyl-prolyl cis-trans isomerase
MEQYEFKSTPSGLGYHMVTSAEGVNPTAGQSVSVHYRGWLESGKEFDNSFKRGQPIKFKLGVGQVIPGWDEGIALLTPGSKAVLRIPSDLGYGVRGAGGVIPPNATLFFEVELVSIG